MSKFCAKGHQMEDSWETCPTCQTTGYQVPGGTGAGGAAAKTRLETEGRRKPQGVPLAALDAGPCSSPKSAKPPVVGWFVAMSGDQKGEDFRLHDGKNSVGSGTDSQIALKDSTVSSQHASVRYEDGKFFVTDLDSSNGTYLNDRKIVREELKDNDMIRFGEIIVKFKRL